MLLLQVTSSCCDLISVTRRHIGDFFFFNFCISHRGLLSSAQCLLLVLGVVNNLQNLYYLRATLFSFEEPQLNWRFCDSSLVWPPVFQSQVNLEISCLGFLASWGPPGGWMWTIHLAGCLCKSWLLSKSPVFEWKPQLPKNRAHTFILCSKLSMTNASEVLPMSAGRCCLLNIYIVVTVWLARYHQTLHTISVLTLCTRKQTREMGQLS